MLGGASDSDAEVGGGLADGLGVSGYDDGGGRDDVGVGVGAGVVAGVDWNVREENMVFVVDCDTADIGGSLSGEGARSRS